MRPLQHIEIFADVGKDDSYTPQRISIRAGTYHGDLLEVKLVDMIAPTGWQQFQLGAEGDEEVSVFSRSVFRRNSDGWRQGTDSSAFVADCYHL